jgi:hypothetical protein
VYMMMFYMWRKMNMEMCCPHIQLRYSIINSSNESGQLGLIL